MPKINIAFDVFTGGDPYTIKIGDYSEWLTIKNSPAVAEITLPGASDPIIYSFVKGAINSYNSTTLYNDCIECEESQLPDGIYNITIRGEGGHFKQKYYLKTDVIDLEIGKKLIELGFVYTDTVKSKYEYIQQIKFHLDSAKANTTEGYIKDASKHFAEAQKMIKCNNC